MYNEQLENLIDAALADGVLTEKEKQILFKKAQAMDIDLDEFEMVLDARLVELKRKKLARQNNIRLKWKRPKLHRRARQNQINMVTLGNVHRAVQWLSHSKLNVLSVDTSLRM